MATTNSTKIHGIGIVKLNMSDSRIKEHIICAESSFKFTSMVKITNYGHEVTFRKDGATIVNAKNEKVIEAKRVAIYMLSKAQVKAQISRTSKKTCGRNFTKISDI